MALPYPREIETGELSPLPALERRPFDVKRQLAAAIRAEGGGLELFGVRIESWSGGTPEHTAQWFRDSLAWRFAKQRPDADQATWELFASEAEALVRRASYADPETLRLLLLSVESL